MENKHYQNINLIIDSIEKQADKEQMLLEEASEKLYKEKYNALEKEIRAKYDKQTAYELSRLTADANKGASELEAEYKAKLAELREKIVDEVYCNAYEKVQNFVKSKKYALLLEDSAKSISTLYDGDAVVHIRKEDEAYKSIISEAFGRTVAFETDGVIKLGGICVHFLSHSVVADDTLDSRLTVNKKDFIKNCGLGFVN